MEVHPLHKYPESTLDNFLRAIPFYKAIMSQDRGQYDLLMSHSRVVEFDPGEIVIEEGQQDQWLYFLVKGQLAVLVGDDAYEKKLINYITPGEVFGDLAVLLEHKRTATVVSDSNCKKVLVFGTDFQVFGGLEDFSFISLTTKLVYYRNMVHNLRWKLEVYRMSFPDKSFASDHRKVKLFSGTKETREELLSLDCQARALARLLVNWNLEFDRFGVGFYPMSNLPGLSAMNA